MKKIHFPLCLAVCLLLSCSGSLKEKGSPEYISDIKVWRNSRIENLKKEEGWLNLVGLHWLQEGSNTFGSDPSNRIIFPEKAPSFMGDFFLKKGVVTLDALPNITVTNEGRLAQHVVLKDDSEDKPTTIKFGTLRWSVVKRGDKIGIRLRDVFSPLVKEFKGVENFPINEDWKIAARFEPSATPKEILIQNVLGQINPTKIVGSIVFTWKKDTYHLDVIEEDDEAYFVIFKDKTNGKGTYGAGRFLSVSKAAEGESFFIDFNKAYNPPCAFTKFATCPLPPKEIFLKIKVTAGEKVFDHAEHK